MNTVFYCSLMDPGVELEVPREFDLKAFAARLEALRRSQQTGERLGREKVMGTDLARALRISKERYYRYERGEIEPPLTVLLTLRELTGVSLDWLLAGHAGGEELEPEPPQITVGQRLKWVRELMAPFIEQFASYTPFDAEDWRAWEEGRAELPVEAALDFKHRFNVTTDYLYTGELAGVEPQIQYELVKRHPELRLGRRRGQVPPPPPPPTPRFAEPAGGAVAPGIPAGHEGKPRVAALPDARGRRSRGRGSDRTDQSSAVETER